jgi:hypothetical protein
LGEQNVNPVTVMLLRQAAEEVDDNRYSVSFRIDALVAYGEIAESAKRQAGDAGTTETYDSVPGEDENDDDTDDSIERGYDYHGAH